MTRAVTRGVMSAAPPAVAGPRLVGLGPQVGPETRLVVLGSFPGIASLGASQYYAHPRNAFWPIVGELLQLPGLSARPYDERLAAIRARGLGLWDVYAACRRTGSLDSAIEAPEFNDFTQLRQAAPNLRAIAHNGGESARAWRQTTALGLPVYRLPSTSPANASWSLARKLAAWREVFVSAGLIDAPATIEIAP